MYRPVYFWYSVYLYISPSSSSCLLQSHNFPLGINKIPTVTIILSQMSEDMFVILSHHSMLCHAKAF